MDVNPSVLLINDGTLFTNVGVGNCGLATNDERFVGEAAELPVTAVCDIGVMLTKVGESDVACDTPPVVETTPTLVETTPLLSPVLIAGVENVGTVERNVAAHSVRSSSDSNNG